MNELMQRINGLLGPHAGKVAAGMAPSWFCAAGVISTFSRSLGHGTAMGDGSAGQE